MMIKKLKPIAAAAVATLALSANADAAVDMFLVIPGISGETDDPAFKGGIDVLAWSWGLSQSGTGGVPGAANVQDVSITKYVDSSSVNLIMNAATGGALASATLSVRKAGTNQLVYIEIYMEGVLVTSVSTGGSGGEDRLTENVTLNFSKITTSYTQDVGGIPIEFCWDAVNKVDCTP